jgi:hypothetical protein
VPIHEPTFAVADTALVAGVRALSAAAAAGEAVRVRSPPAYTVLTSAANGADAPATLTPEEGVVASELLERVPVLADEAAGAAGSDVHAPSARATSAAVATGRWRRLPGITLQP